MKIASDARKLFFRRSSALALILLIGAAAPSAAEAARTMAAPALAPLNAVNENSTTVTLPAPLPATAAQGNSGNRHNLGPLEDKVSDSIKNVVKQLGTIDSVNLDDLNTARQAVAKLDVLIEIEKRLAELDKLHNSERGGERSLASAIPASALSAPPMPMIMPKSPPPVENFAALGSSHEVSRIIGANGHYTATVQGKSVRVGDTLSDGSSVVAITARQVDTKSKDGSTHQLKVKGVEQVFGHTL